MAYEYINEIEIKTDFIARDVTIINYNQILADIKAYLEKLNQNIHYIHLTGGGTNGGPGVYYDDNLPPIEERYEGLTWFDEE